MNHHARLFVANSIKESAIESELQTSGEDIVHIVREKLRIDDARDIKKYAFQRPVARTYRDLVIFADIYLREAQNALLKLLEEPPASTRLTLVVKDEQQLLATVRSRLLYSTANQDTETALAEQFLATKIPSRLAAIDRLTKDKDKKTMRSLLQQCTRYYIKNYRDKFSKSTYRALNFSNLAMQLNGSSDKMLLEYVALTLPIMKTK